jgi:hypothetical protein
MIAGELVRRSPLRILERSTHGGVGEGNVGVFTGPKGVGKTACLVHVATDRLLQGKHVVHVSFSGTPSHIMAWYEDIFAELARQYRLDNTTEAHDSVVKNRIIMNYERGSAEWPRVEKTVRALMENADFSADTVVVDGYAFPEADLEAFRAFRRFAAEAGLELWFSASAPKPSHEGAPALPSSYEADCAVVIALVDRGTHIHLELVRDHGEAVHDVHLKLDPHSLLIAEEG